MATPRVFGQELRLTANLCLARDASATLVSPVFNLSPTYIRTQQRLVGTSTSSNDTNHTTCAALDDLLGTGWELNTGLTLIWVVSNDGDVVSGSTAKRTTVTSLLLNIRNDGTLWDGAEREDVSDSKSCVLACVDELTGVHSLVGDESLGVKLEPVWITENNLG